MHTLSQRSIRNLEGVHPDLVRVVMRTLQRSRYDFVVVEGLRSIERQRELVQAGRSQTLDSKHLKQPDGYGHAVDLVACGDLDGDGDIDAQDKNLTWNRYKYEVIANEAKLSAAELGVGIKWGGDFRKGGLAFFDGPHFQLEKQAPRAG